MSMRPFQWLLSAGILCLSACTQAAQKPTALFDRAATLELVKTLSSDEMQGRLPGTAASIAAQDVIIARMEAIGLKPISDSFRRPFTYGPIAGADTKPSLTGVNLIGILEGTGESDLTMVVTAHYDHVGVLDGEVYNGADDNASGVGGMLAIAEHFAANPPRHSVIFAALDVEESHGFAGARDFIRRPPIALEQIGFNLNLDMLSRGDNGQLWASGTSHWLALKPLVEEVAEAASIDLRMGYDQGGGRDDWTLLSDHAVFFQAGIPHLYLGVEDHADYHQPSDDFERIDQAWYLSAVETAIIIADAVNADLARLNDMAED
ncbi:MAG: M20/M25/M40 family metallo-hydrolase [Henriciella sp.]